VILKIVQPGHPALRQDARTLTYEEISTPATQSLIASLFDTMRDAPGVGLAAPQVGIPVAVAVIEDRQEYIDRLPADQVSERRRAAVPAHVLINPKLTVETPAAAEFYEGCLSLPGFSAIVPRALRVKVDALNERGERVSIDAEGWYARILQHEIDHLNGALYIDRMHPKTFTTRENAERFPGPAPEPRKG
jgi:peptide deformylase